jgi:membrane associated rhomboid family serine protease
MFRRRGENLRSVYVLLFLNVAFFLLQNQDPGKYVRVFSFNWDAVRAGEVWRLVTYQFRQPGSGFSEALWLFVTMLLLYMMGSALEEEWGTFHFVALFGISTLTSAGVAAWLGIPLLGTYFVTFTLLYVYASVFPQQTFYLFGLIPFPVRLLAALSLAYLLYGVFAGGESNVAVFSGALAGYIYYLTQRVPARAIVARAEKELAPVVRVDSMAMQNGARFAAMKHVLAHASEVDIDRLITQCDRDTVPNVNICPPADFKPENNDGYCIRCEGFSECSARFLRASRPAVVARAEAPAAVPDATA